MTEKEQELPEGMVDHVTIHGSSDAHFDDYASFWHVPGTGQSAVIECQFAEYKAWKLAQATAKVKELRELLREIEWGLEGFGGFVCPACHIGGDTPVPIPHASDCWLKAEIDQLEPERGE